ncbi:TonB-dependent receptor plug domain-containing protein [Chryseolinea soli]|uniref:TonB-dependent receptor n=1 Tax=Chryseolinea soli TaxID=2321403 RepID=A0A385SFK8_9BACT|nr:TonB-dependent receptor [Chryseolinea soli]AYB29672.1 TonB-dependent receptor [Chryseolinea soli]
MKRLLLPIALFTSFAVFAQVPDSLAQRDRVFTLGEVLVVGSPIDTANALSFKKIEKFNRTDVSNTLNILSGVTLANVGPRNESVVYVRGFDLRQVPVFIDGVPVYVPYDGYVDMGRFTSVDLAQVNVSKGFSSILYGANTMGGAINLVSRKPQQKFELGARVGAFSGEGFRWNVNAGSNLGKYYFQLGLSQLKQNYFPLSKDFTAMPNEDGGERGNSYRDDIKFSVKAGFTPNATDEYVVGYVTQHGEKGTPPYTGTDPKMQTRFWQWPKWDKQSLYFITNTALGTKNKLKTRWYYDTFVNELFSYDDATYSTMTKGYAFQSYYDDYTVGGSAELESHVISKNTLRLGVQYKRDIHRENNLGEPQRTFIDNTLSIGLENTYQIMPTVAIVPGISYNARNSSKAQDYNATTKEISDFPSNNNNAVNAQLGIFWDVNPNHTLKGSVSRKTRFATIKDRYSYRMGQAIPNPDLSAEVAVNYDLTYTGKFFTKLVVTASAFRSDISNIIQQVDNVQPGRFQLQNAGDALFYGYEANADYNLAKGLNLGINYTYMRRKNETNPAIFFTNVPDHKIFGFVDYSFLSRVNILASAERNSKRYSTSYGTSAGGYTLVNTKASVKLIKNLQLEGGVNNIFDTNYALVEGFPEAGRNYFVSLSFRNF